MRRFLWVLVPLCLLVVAMAEKDRVLVRVGSKKFTESVILGEMFTFLARDAGADALHQKEMQGTRIVWLALTQGDIDVYPERAAAIQEVPRRGRTGPGDELSGSGARSGTTRSPPR